MAVDICGLCGCSVNASTGASFQYIYIYIFSLKVLLSIERKGRKLLHGPSCRLELQILKVEISRVSASVSSIDGLSSPAAYLCTKCQRLLLRRSNLQKQLMECISNIHSKLTLLIPNTQQPSNALSFDTEQQPMTTATAHIEKQPMGTTSTIAEQQPMGTTATIAEQQPMGTMDNNLSPGAVSSPSE